MNNDDIDNIIVQLQALKLAPRSLQAARPKEGAGTEGRDTAWRVTPNHRPSLARSQACARH